MFRQKRKQRYEVAAHVEQLTDGMTARDLTEHLRFWKIITKWDPEPNANKDFIIDDLKLGTVYNVVRSVVVKSTFLVMKLLAINL